MSDWNVAIKLGGKHSRDGIQHISTTLTMSKTGLFFAPMIEIVSAVPYDPEQSVLSLRQAAARRAREVLQEAAQALPLDDPQALEALDHYEDPSEGEFVFSLDDQPSVENS